MESENIFKQNSYVSRKDKEDLLRQESFVLWFTGLSGSGKSTLARALEFELYKRGHLTCLLDGDNIRSGLNRDLGFSRKDREENLRRVAHIAKLLLETGIIVITAFISPYAKTRDYAKNLIGRKSFIEIFLDCPLDTCISRDPKGLYKKALDGKIDSFTGISSDFEKLGNPDIRINTGSIKPEDSVNIILKYLNKESLI